MAANAKDRTMTEHVEGHAASAATMRIWDPLVRVFHWGLVAAVATAWLTADEVQPVHEFAGYTVAGLVAFRLIWGFAGSRYARFAQFVKGPGATRAYLRSMLRGNERRYLGHNPAGAAMIVAPAWADGDGDDHGEGREVEGPLKEVHETLANLMLLLVAAHIGGVVLASIRHGENLARAMITGDKRAPAPGDIV